MTPSFMFGSRGERASAGGDALPSEHSRPTYANGEHPSTPPRAAAVTTSFARFCWRKFDRTACAPPVWVVWPAAPFLEHSTHGCGCEAHQTSMHAPFSASLSNAGLERRVRLE